MGKDKSGGNFDKIDAEYRDAVNKAVKKAAVNPSRRVPSETSKKNLKRAIGKVERGKGKGSGKK